MLFMSFMVNLIEAYRMIDPSVSDLSTGATVESCDGASHFARFLAIL
jgi:hypothetical protein